MSDSLQHTQDHVAVRGMHKLCGDPDCTESIHDRAQVSQEDWDALQHRLRTLEDMVERLSRGDTVGRLL